MSAKNDERRACARGEPPSSFVYSPASVTEGNRQRNEALLALVQAYGKPGPSGHGRILGPFAMAVEPELWVLTREIDSQSDPFWNESLTIAGTPDRIRSMFDLSNGVPYGWRLLKGKQAQRFMRDSLKAEQRYQREQRAKEKFGGEN